MRKKIRHYTIGCVMMIRNYAKKHTVLSDLHIKHICGLVE